MYQFVCKYASLVEEEREGVEAEDDARHVLAVVHVRRLGSEHLRQPDVPNGLQIKRWKVIFNRLK